MADALQDARILVVDDEDSNVILLQRILARAGYSRVVGTTDPTGVAELCRADPPDLVLLDLRMPRMDGYAVLEQLVPQGDESTRPGFLPVIVLTADDTGPARQRALSAGAADFLSKPFEPFEILLRIRNLLRTRRLYLRLEDRSRLLEERLVQRTRALERSQREMLQRLAQAVESRDGETGEHTRRVGENSARLAGALGFDDEQVELIRRAAPLHDVGKIGIPDAVLLKPGLLTPQERQVVNTHTTIGAAMLSGSDSELMQLAECIARSHHERWDGTGYPDGLAGEEIPLVARIVAVVDVFDALAHDRPYRGAWPMEQVVAEIERMAGSHFDPVAARALLRLHASGELMVADRA